VSGDVEKPGAGRGNNVEVDDFDRNNLNPFMAGPPQFTHLSMGGYNKAKWSLMTGLQLRVRVHRILGFTYCCAVGRITRRNLVVEKETGGFRSPDRSCASKFALGTVPGHDVRMDGSTRTSSKTSRLMAPHTAIIMHELEILSTAAHGEQKNYEHGSANQQSTAHRTDPFH
jgi:hypothetical protein